MRVIIVNDRAFFVLLMTILARIFTKPSGHLQLNTLRLEISPGTMVSKNGAYPVITYVVPNHAV